MTDVEIVRSGNGYACDRCSECRNNDCITVEYLSDCVLNEHIKFTKRGNGRYKEFFHNDVDGGFKTVPDILYDLYTLVMALENKRPVNRGIFLSRNFSSNVKCILDKLEVRSRRYSNDNDRESR